MRDLLKQLMLIVVVLLIVAITQPADAAPSPIAVLWEKPTKNTDGSELANLSGYNVYVFPAGSKTPSQVILVRGSTSTSTTIVMENSCVSVTSLTTSGAESAASNFACIGNATPPDLPPGPNPTGPEQTTVIYVGPASQ